MPNTLIPIQTIRVGASGATSLTFSNIPQTYTDLVVHTSLRTSGSVTSGIARCRMQINSITSGYSNHLLFSLGAATPTSGNGTDYITFFYANDSTATSNTFSNSSIYINNYTGSTNKTASVDSIAESNSNSAGILSLNSGSLSNSAAITSLTITQADGFTLVENSTATLYGISNGVKATGGTLTVAGGYAYHTFTSTGSFLPSQKITGAEVLCIAGGGAGGRSYGGGGGAGGLLFANSQTLTAGNLYTALIGAGGSSQSASAFRGNSGNNSVFGSSIAFGGGGGGYDAGGGTGATGIAGGSGGGGSRTFSGGAGTLGQGNRGGNISAGNFGAGGGGAGAAGGDSGTAATAGGIGSSVYSVWGAVTGTGQLVGGVYYYAGGGGGQAQAGGLGGGGQNRDGAPGTVANGTANTGGGSGSDSTASAGGSGLIIVRYPLS